MRDSERYEAQAKTVLRLAARVGDTPEKAVYLNIAESWRKLAAEAARNEERVAEEPRSFDRSDKG